MEQATATAEVVGAADAPDEEMLAAPVPPEETADANMGVEGAVPPGAAAQQPTSSTLPSPRLSEPEKDGEDLPDYSAPDERPKSKKLN